MRYSGDSPLHRAIKTLPHVAFAVDDLDAALEGLDVMYPPGSPSEGVCAAMILVDGAPVERIWFSRNVYAPSTTSVVVVGTQGMRGHCDVGGTRDIGAAPARATERGVPAAP
jgi:hypothetical protein